MSKIPKILLVALLLAVFLFLPSSMVRSQGAIVHAVLLYSSTCGHYYCVITEVLPPLFKQYGNQLQLLEVDVTQLDGQALFQTVLQKFNLESGGVPFLVIGNIYLIGSADIPEQFPNLIEQYLAQGGVDLPPIPGLAVTWNTQESTVAATPTATPIPIVRAVLFYRSSCGHCQHLVAEILPPIIKKYGAELEIYYCDVSKTQGDALFTAAIARFNIKAIGVPTVIVGNDVLIGNNIQQKFPKIIDEGLSHGGLDWPDIPGLSQTLKTAGSTELPTAAYAEYPPEFSPVFPTTTPVVEDLPAGSQNSSSSQVMSKLEKMQNNFDQDPPGNTLSVVILAGMITSVIFGIRAFLKQPGAPLSRHPVWVIPGLCVLGSGIAGYLAYVEITSVETICGPVGHCQTVQQSEYARLFGVLPIGLLGLAGYVAIMIAWLVGRSSSSKFSKLASLALLGMTASGTLFSIYLTFLEPFVIGATCAWCLSSAVIMTILMYLSIAPGKLAFSRQFIKRSTTG